MKRAVLPRAKCGMRVLLLDPLALHRLATYSKPCWVNDPGLAARHTSDGSPQGGLKHRAQCRGTVDRQSPAGHQPSGQARQRPPALGGAAG